MKQFGIVETQTPATFPVDDQGDPIITPPYPLPEDWRLPTLIPLVKLDQPAHDPATQDCIPTLVWHADRVERDWQIVPISAERARLTARTALRTQWESLPAWIRGPFGDKFDAAYRMVIAGDYDAAIALIAYAEMPSAYTIEQAATFAQVQTQMAAGIAALAQI